MTIHRNLFRAMHKIEQRPVVVSGQIVIRPMMYVALSSIIVLLTYLVPCGREPTVQLPKKGEKSDDSTS